MNREDYEASMKKVRTIRGAIKPMSDSIDSLEEQNQGLQSLLDFKQQEISVLESKVLELEEWEYPN